MKNLLLASLAALFLAGAAAPAFAQSGAAAPAAPAADGKARHLPAVSIRSLGGKPVSAAALPGVGQGKPTIISFWATWCKPCISELTNIKELFPDLQQQTGVQLIAISIDDARNAAKVGPLARGRGWDYPIYLDENQDLKRALNVNNVPHTFLLNGAGEIVWQHTSYNEGDENHLIELVRQLARGETIKQ